MFYLVGFANVALQLLTKNLAFACFGFLCLAISALSLFPKIRKITLVVRLMLLSCAMFYCLYLHNLYGSYLTDYKIIAIEVVLCIALSIVYAIPKKEPPSIEGGSAF